MTEEVILLESVEVPPLEEAAEDAIIEGVGLELDGCGEPWCPLGVEAPEPGPRRGLSPFPVVIAAINC